jgi:hypothetical protein
MLGINFKKLFFSFTFFAIAQVSMGQVQANDFTDFISLPAQFQNQRILNPEQSGSSGFGKAIDMSNQSHRIIVSSRKNNKGIVYLYELDANGAFQNTKTFELNSNDPNAATFGRVVAISEDFIAIATDTESIYIYKKNSSGNWPLLQTLNVSITNNFVDRPIKFIYGNGDNNLIIGDRGAKTVWVYKYSPNQNTFVQKAALSPGQPANFDVFPLEISGSIPASGDPGGIITASGSLLPTLTGQSRYRVYRWISSNSNTWDLPVDWQNDQGVDGSNNPIIVIKNTLQLPFIYENGEYKPNPSPLGDKLSLFKRDLLISNYFYTSATEPPVYAGLRYYRASSTSFDAPFQYMNIIPPDPININKYPWDVFDPVQNTLVYNPNPPAQMVMVNQTLAINTNLEFLSAFPNNGAGAGYVLLYQRNSATNTFERWKLLITTTSPYPLNSLTMDGQYVVAAATAAEYDANSSIFIWKYNDDAFYYVWSFMESVGSPGGGGGPR